MSVSITFNGDSWAEVAEEMRAALGTKTLRVAPSNEIDVRVAEPITHDPGAGETVDVTPAEEPKAEEPKRRGRPPKDKSDADKAMDQPHHGHDDEPQVLNYEKDVKAKVLDFAADFDREAIMGVLSTFNVVNAAQIPAEDLPALLDLLTSERERLEAAK